MDIPATTPVTVDPVPAKVFDKWVIDQLRFAGDGVSSPLSAEAFFKLGSKDEAGNWEFHPTERKNLFIPDLWSLAAADLEVGQVMQDVVALVTRLGVEAGVL